MADENFSVMFDNRLKGKPEDVREEIARGSCQMWNGSDVKNKKSRFSRRDFLFIGQPAPKF